MYHLFLPDLNKRTTLAVFNVSGNVPLRTYIFTSTAIMGAIICIIFLYIKLGIVCKLPPVSLLDKISEIISQGSVLKYTNELRWQFMMVIGSVLLRGSL